jgi:hypothetical protein
MANPNFEAPPADWFVMNPADAVRNGVARQKWAVDNHDLDELQTIYARDCLVVMKWEGVEEFYRERGRDAILEHLRRGWENQAAWKPGAVLHHVGSIVIEPAAGRRIRCRSCSTYFFAVAPGKTENGGFGHYHDYWCEEEGQWRLQEREVHLFGCQRPSQRIWGNQE